jgi:hypothetical protein
MIEWMFYNAKAEGAKLNLAHSGIMLISKPYIHVETRFSDGVSWSSEYGIGPRFKQIEYSNPDRWTSCPHPWLTKDDEVLMRRRAAIWCELRKANMSKYDIHGALGCAITGNENPFDPFCSEGEYEIYPDVWKILCLNHKLHPQRLFELYECMATAFIGD